MHKSAPQASVSLSRRKVVLGLSMMGLSGLAQARMPQPNVPPITSKNFEALIPDHVGAFTFQSVSGLVLPPPDALSARLYDNIVTRTYTDPTDAVVMLMIAYNNKQDGLLQLHRPEICYPAGGYTLTSVDPIDVPLTPASNLPSQIFAARSDERNEVVLYWSRVGEAFPRQWAEQRLAVARANLLGIVPDGMLVRVSVLGRDIAQAVPTLFGFSRALYNASTGRGRRLLFGDT